MENDNVDVAPPGGAAPASSRWNPTKEQITMLESLYKQGIRTPSAEQIQHITNTLRAYGHIEGKNVFYWFQNHKARQRQKQKQRQENMALVNRFLHNKPRPPPLLIPAHQHHLPPCTNVVCSPSYYMQHGAVGFYPPLSPHHPKVLLPGRRPPLDKVAKTKEIVINGGGGGGGGGYADAQQSYNSMISMEGGDNGNERLTMMNRNNNTSNETLDLFPLYPTGILETSRSFNSFKSDPSSSSEMVAEEGYGGGEQPFIDFFGWKASCEGE